MWLSLKKKDQGRGACAANACNFKRVGYSLGEFHLRVGEKKSKRIVSNKINDQTQTEGA